MKFDLALRKRLEQTEKKLKEAERRGLPYSPGLYLHHYLIHSYLYYILGTSIIEDATFDLIAAGVERHWDRLAGHPHRSLLNKGLLKSGFHIRAEDYPGVCVGAANRLLRTGDDWPPPPHQSSRGN